MTVFPSRAVRLLVALLCCCIVSGCARRASVSMPERPFSEALDDIQADVRYLASDELRGRLVGEPGIADAETYIAARLMEAGLLPEPDLGGYFQEFPVTRTGFDPESISLLASGPSGTGNADGDQAGVDDYVGVVGVDFRPLPFCGTGELTAELVYAGFGIHAPEARYSDYDGLDVRGKIVLVLRGEPEPDDPSSPFYGPGSTYHAYFQTKGEAAFRRGAAGVIVVNPIGREERPTDFTIFDSFELEETGSRNPAAIGAQVDDRFIALLSSQSLLDWAAGYWGLQADRVAAQASSGVRPVDLTLEPLSVTVTVGQLEPVRGVVARNVIAVAPGANSDRLILLGAHHDHLGTIGTGAAAGDDDVIFNGADDNASGVAVLLEVARQLSGVELPATVYYVTFSAEEHGLLGSSTFVSSRLRHLPDIDLMINVDMAGGNSPDPVVVLETGGVSLGGASLQSIAHEVGLPVNVVGTGVGGSDHIPFEQFGAPIVFASSGIALDYHGVDDEADRIEYDRVYAISAFVRDLIVAASGN